MSSAYYTERNYNYVVYARTAEILTDISNLPDIGEYSINKSNVFEMNMDDKHKSELTEYGKNIKNRYYAEDKNGNLIDNINIISLNKRLL